MRAGWQSLGLAGFLRRICVSVAAEDPIDDLAFDLDLRGAPRFEFGVFGNFKKD